MFGALSPTPSWWWSWASIATFSLPYCPGSPRTETARCRSQKFSLELACLLGHVITIWQHILSSLVTSPSGAKKWVFPDSPLLLPEGLVKLIRFTMGSHNRRCRDVSTSSLTWLQSLTLEIAPQCPSRRIFLPLSIHWHSNSAHFSA
jgi:hypothetical protein